MTPDPELLRRFAQDRDEAAFAELVRRYVDFVYATALRLVNNDAHAAQDVSQTVFTDMARKAWRLAGRTTVSGWLHTSVRYAASKHRRGETRRHLREQEAFAMQDNSPSPEVNWEQLQPALDEAVGRLREPERDALVLRFFQNKSHREVGEALGLAEEAARKRVDRALEKLRAHFASRGVTVSSALLAASIAANSAQAAPIGLAATFTGASLASAGQAGFITIFFQTLYMTTKTKMTLVAAIVVAAAATIPITVQYREISQLREQVASLQQANPQAARSQNRGVGQAADAPHSLTIAEIQAQIKALSGGGRNWRNQWQAFINSLDPADISKVTACLEEMPALNRRASYLIPLLTFWAKSDPQGALAYLDKYPPGTLRDMETAAIVEGWTDKDPEAAAAWWQQLPAGRLRVDVSKAIIGALVEKNPQAAYELTLDTAPRSQVILVQDVFFSWARTDPAGALAQISQMKTTQLSRLRDLAFSRFAMGYAESDPEAAFAWVNALPRGSDKATALSVVLPSFAEHNSKEALDYVLNLPPGEERDGSIRSFARMLADNDAQAAWSFVQQLPDGRDKQNAQTMLVNQWAHDDPAGAIAMVLKLPPTDAQGQQLNRIASTWAQDAPNDALAALEDIPPGSNRDSFVGGLFSGTLANSPEIAASLVPSLPANRQAAAADQVTYGLAAVDPPAAAAWMSSLAEGTTSPGAFNYVVSSWAKYDPAATGQWIQSLPSGTSQDTAIQTYVDTLTKSYPATAASWATAIGDETKRNTAIERVVQNWLVEDPATASAWLDQTSLPAERKQKLILQSQSGEAPPTQPTGRRGRP